MRPAFHQNQLARPDPADSFSNLDLTIAQSSTGAVTPGSVFFSGDGWKPYDLAADKIRIEAVKLEPGKTYGYWINSQSFKNFKDQQGHPAVPYLLVFQTKG